MKFKMLLGFLLVVAQLSYGQLDVGTPGIKKLPNGGSVRGLTGERVGITDIMINYGRPSVKGREGKIWGGVVPEGLSPNPFFRGKKMPWRGGANENTIISFSTDVMIEGKELKAGKYGLHMIYGKDESTVIFSKNAESWGSFYYREENDVMRVKVKAVENSYSTERLMYAFSDQTDSSAVVSVVWEKMAIPFVVSTQLQELQLAEITAHMEGVRSFNPRSYIDAARYYYEHDIDMDQALQYASAAKAQVREFYPSYLVYNILKKQGKNKAADSMIYQVIEEVPARELSRYGYTFLKDKEYDIALTIFKKRVEELDKDYNSLIGIAKVYSALGKYKTATKYANKAKKLVQGKQVAKVDKMIEQLKKGKDINT